MSAAEIELNRLWESWALPPDWKMALVLLVLGTLYCFLGYRTLKFAIGLTGFLLAGVAAAVMAIIFFPEEPLYPVFSFVLGGVCGVLALLFLYKAGVFVLGSMGTFLIAQTFLAERLDAYGPWAIVLTGLAGGVAALVLESLIMTLATAAIGSWILVGTIAALVSNTPIIRCFDPAPGYLVENTLLVVVWIFVAFAGALTQLSFRKKSASTEENPASR